MKRKIEFRVFNKEEQKYIYNVEKTCEFKKVLKNNNYIIEQFTGLKDKNGNKIFEGDIVDKYYSNLNVYEGNGEVKFGTGWDSDGYLHCKWCGWKAGESSLYDVYHNSNIIGNIHNNPELIKNDKQ